MVTENSKREEGPPERWSAQRKTEVVLRLLRGEDLGKVSREIQVPAHEVEEWRRVFLAGGTGHLKRRGADEIWVIPATGGTATQLTFDGMAQDWRSAWSPVADEIAFQSDRSGNFDIWTIPVAGGPAAQGPLRYLGADPWCDRHRTSHLGCDQGAV